MTDLMYRVTTKKENGDLSVQSFQLKSLKDTPEDFGEYFRQSLLVYFDGNLDEQVKVELI